MAKKKYTMTIERDDLDEVNILIDDNQDVFYNGKMMIDLDLALKSELITMAYYRKKEKEICINYAYGSSEDTFAGLYDYLEEADAKQLRESNNRASFLFKPMDLERIFKQLIANISNEYTCEADYKAISEVREVLLAIYDKAADKTKDYTDVPGLEV
tara:strand:- start:308 stop:778 length:471 start_codon:yes stop_codon:yes gene_type:complete